MKDGVSLQEIAQLVAESAITKYSKEIAIIAIYGSVALGTQSKYSDLDIYAIVDDNNAIDPSLVFIFQNKSVDFWSMNWERAEKIASGEGEPLAPWCVAASLFTNCKILYFRSEEDKKRFEKLKELIKETEEDKEKNLQRIIDSFNTLYAFIERIHLAEENEDVLYARWASWELIIGICKILSLLNSRYFTKNWESNLQQAMKLPLVPNDFEKLLKVLATSDKFNELIITGRLLIAGTRELIYNEQQQSPAKKKDSSSLGKDFIGIKEYSGKIRSACEEKDILTASYAASELQVWTTELVSEINGKLAADFNLIKEIDRSYHALGLPDLSQYVSRNDLEGLQQATTTLEQLLWKFLTDRGADILNFQELEEIHSYLNSKEQDSKQSEHP
ncbi:MAG: nucleotidyltransferase domain-containing protein [Candidatus Heimdallarchaeota archaeon]